MGQREEQLFFFRVWVRVWVLGSLSSRSEQLLCLLWFQWLWDIGSPQISVFLAQGQRSCFCYEFIYVCQSRNSVLGLYCPLLSSGPTASRLRNGTVWYLSTGVRVVLTFSALWHQTWKCQLSLKLKCNNIFGLLGILPTDGAEDSMRLAETRSHWVEMSPRKRYRKK